MTIQIPVGTPTNAKRAGYSAEFTARPNSYTRWVNANTDRTFTRQPKTLVNLTASSGIINMSQVGIENQEFVIGSQTFKFVTAYTEPVRLAGEVLIAAGAGAQETNIKLAIVLDRAIILASAIEDGDKVVVTATTPGVAGNLINFSTTATGMTMTTTVAGHLGGGLEAVVAETLVVGDDTYTYIAFGETPGASEIALGEDLPGTIASIISTVDSKDIEITNDELVVSFTAIAIGLDGNDITITSTGYATGSGATSGAVVGHKSTVKNNLTYYTFCDDTGDSFDHLAEDYPTHVKVATESEANVTDVAAAYIAKLKLDTTTFSNTSVSNLLGVCTVGYKNTGSSGNAIDFISDMETPSDLVVRGITEGHFTGGSTGSVGLNGQLLRDSSYLYVCQDVNTINDDNWTRAALSSF